MYSFGLGDRGQLGQVSKTKSYTPGLVRGDHQKTPLSTITTTNSNNATTNVPTKPKHIFLIAAGGRHSLAATGHHFISQNTFSIKVK
jgi:hypothetical protein